jgi:murein DD-endopeptidase MepM/ murein hydrolase activator NlpD
MPEDRRMTFIVVPHGSDATTRSFEVSYRRLRTIAIAAASFLLLVAVVTGSWLWLAGQAARVPTLRGEVAELREERERMEELAATLERLALEYAKVRVMLGADSVSLPVIQSPADEVPTGIDPAAASDTLVQSAIPHRWPLAARGFTTRRHRTGPVPHPGLDIAVPRGSRILAVAAGRVVHVGEDRVYGRYVRIAHGNGYESLYAHAEEVLVTADEPVGAGRTIALSGSSGVSTGPHLHFEIRRHGEPVDPAMLISNPN